MLKHIIFAQAINCPRKRGNSNFSIVSGSLDEAYASISCALDNAVGSTEGLRLTDDEPPRVAYTGPLGRERTLKLDLASDELVINTEQVGLLPRWPDLPDDAIVHVYTLTEIAGEKIRCVMQRLQCRDLFDLSLLFDAGGVDVVEAAEIFAPKAVHHELDPATFAVRYANRIDQYRQRWQAELREHVAGDVPHFDAVERHVSRSLRRAGLV